MSLATRRRRNKALHVLVGVNKRFSAAVVFIVALSARIFSKTFLLDIGVDLNADDLSALPLHPETSHRPCLKYDEAGIKPIPGTARSHGLPFAVPSRTIPRHLAEDRAYHLSQRLNTTKRSIRPPRKTGEFDWTHDYTTDYRTLYLFNPSVLPLHNTIPSADSSDPDYLSDFDLNALTGGDPAVRYLVTYRAYLACNCFGPDRKREIIRAGEQINYLAIALLDEKLDLISGTDILVDLNAGPSHGKYIYQAMADCRLFLLAGNLYLVCNERISHVKIRRVPRGGRRRQITKIFTGPNLRTPYVYPNLYGKGLEITLFTPSSKIAEGKNFNIFRSRAMNRSSTQTASTGPFDYFVQLYPLPHRYHRLRTPPPSHVQDDFKTNPHVLREEREHISTAPLPHPSFDTPDTKNTILMCDGQGEKHVNIYNCPQPKEVPFFADNDHGTACCVTMELEGKGDVMVGISHTKLSSRNRWWKKDLHRRYDHFGRNQFVSRFLAYKATPPFDIVARSGWFCLGFAAEEEGLREGGNTLAGRNTQYRLNLFNDTFACPIIHFASGFSEYVGDPSKAIIAYGVNDCHPRMMAVEKSDIARLLLGRV